MADTYEDTECLEKIKQVFTNYLETEENNVNSWKYSLKLQCLLNVLKEAKETMVIFVEHKVTAKHMSDILRREGFACDFVIGHGKVKMYSLQKSILNKQNIITTTEYREQG